MLDAASLRLRVERSSRLSSFKLAAKTSNCASLIVSMVLVTSEPTLLAAETGVADGASADADGDSAEVETLERGMGRLVVMRVADKTATLRGIAAVGARAAAAAPPGSLRARLAAGTSIEAFAAAAAAADAPVALGALLGAAAGEGVARGLEAAWRLGLVESRERARAATGARFSGGRIACVPAAARGCGEPPPVGVLALTQALPGVKVPGVKAAASGDTTRRDGGAPAEELEPECGAKMALWAEAPAASNKGEPGLSIDAMGEMCRVAEEAALLPPALLPALPPLRLAAPLVCRR